MKNPAFIFLFLAILFTSCTQGGPVASVKKDVIFPVNNEGDLSDLYFDNALNTEVVFFCDKFRNKSILFYNTSGKLLYRVPIPELLKKIDHIARITVISPDTIIVNSNYTNEIAIINRFGKVWRKLDLADRLKDNNGNHYELMAAAYPSIQNRDGLLFNCSWRSNEDPHKAKGQMQTSLDRLNYFYGNCYHSPYFITVSNYFSEDPKISFQLPGFYKNLSDQPQIFAEPPFYALINERIIVNSLYSDRLFIYDRKSFALTKTVDVVSDYTTIGTNSIRLAASEVLALQDSLSFKAMTAGRIERVLYSTAEKAYYCIIKHKTTVNNYKQRKVPFSVVKYDSGFSVRNEYLFPDFKYNPDHAFITTEGLLLLRNDTTKMTIKNDKATYSLFDFN